MEPLVGSVSNPNEGAPRWTFLTNHFLVLVAIAGNQDLRVRDIAEQVGITERATQALLSDLVHEGFVERVRIGRRNRYKLRRGAPLRHPLVQTTTLGELLDALRPRSPRVAAS